MMIFQKINHLRDMELQSWHLLKISLKNFIFFKVHGSFSPISLKVLKKLSTRVLKCVMRAFQNVQEHEKIWSVAMVLNFDISEHFHLNFHHFSLSFKTT